MKLLIPRLIHFFWKYSDQSGFRPSAISSDIEDLELRLKMEQYEVRAEPFFLSLGGVAIASAAHINKSAAEVNAKIEAVERVSLAAWWACRRPWVEKIDHQELLEEYCSDFRVMDTNLRFSAGIVESAQNGYNVACTIVKYITKHPSYVLGGGCSSDKKDSVRKSFLEAIQSQVATQKIIEMGNMQNMPYWDSRELENRFYDKRVSLPCIGPNMMHDVKLGKCHTVYLDDIYISSFVSHAIRTHRSYDLAQLAVRQDEPICVFSQHNI